MRARFLIHGPLVPGTAAILTGDEFHHAARVARIREGELIEVLDGMGAMAEARVTQLRGHDAEVEIIRVIEASREQPLLIELAQALIQPDRFELVLQKGVELGVTRFVPMITAHVETRTERVAGKRDRWEKIVLEAVKQCGRSVVPLVDEPTSFARVLERTGARVLFDADAEPTQRLTVRPDQVTLLIGPEGGWSPAELTDARAAGCEFRRLGPRRLRAETAAITAVAAVGLEWGDIGAKRN